MYDGSGLGLPMCPNYKQASKKASRNDCSGCVGGFFDGKERMGKP